VDAKEPNGGVAAHQTESTDWQDKIKKNKVVTTATILSIVSAPLVSMGMGPGFVLAVGSNSVWMYYVHKQRYYVQMPIWVWFNLTSLVGVLLWLKVF